MAEIVILVGIIALGVALLYLGGKLWRRVTAAPAGTELELPPRPLRPEVGERDVAPDELVYLFCHNFCIPAKKRPPMDGRYDKVGAPLSDEEVDGQHLAIQMLYATLTELHRQGCLDFRAVTRSATFMPPLPQKSWELHVRRYNPLPPSPVGDCLQVSIDMLERKRITRAKAKEGSEEVELTEDDLYLPLDDVIERALRVMRQELTFWEKKGVYGDLCSYVASALIARGHLEDVSGDTWLDKVRNKRLAPNRKLVDPLATDADRLLARLGDFRRRYGSEEAQEPDEPGGPAHGRVAPLVTTGGDEPENLPLDDCLRVSIYETLVCMRQLEPSGGI
jgi:hypothetical protein